MPSASRTPTIISSASATANPYAAAAASGPDSGFDGAPKEKVGKAFRFNAKGKYVAQAEQLRKDVSFRTLNDSWVTQPIRFPHLQAQLEALKQRIAERAGRAGLDSEFEVLEKSIRVCAPSISVFFRLLRN